MITISYWALAAICLGLGAAAYGLGWWSAWRADTVLVDIQEGNWITQVIEIKTPEGYERSDEAWKLVI